MKRGVFAVALVACSTPADPVNPPVVPLTPAVTLTLVDRSIVAVRGESTPIPLVLASQALSEPTVTVELGPLPAGLSATTATWNPFDSPALALTLNAAPDAPAARITFEVRAVFDGNIVATTVGSLAVSELAGSPDTTFGAGGIVELPSLDTPVEIVATSNDTFVIGGLTATGASAVFTRIHADGTLDTSFGQSGYATPSGELAAMSIASDGRVALGKTDDGLAYDIVTFDANGAELSTFPAPFAPSAIAWAGDGLFVGGQDQLAYVDASHFATLANLPLKVFRLADVDATSVLVAGKSPSDSVVAKYVFSGSTLALDTTYGSSGSVSLGVDEAIMATTADPNGDTIASFSDGIARVSPIGTLDGVSLLGLTMPHASAVASTPASETLFVTEVDVAPNDSVALLARFDAAGVLDDKFGTLGTTMTHIDAAGISPSSVALNAGATRAYVVGRISRQASINGYVARYRLSSTP